MLTFINKIAAKLMAKKVVNTTTNTNPTTSRRVTNSLAAKPAIIKNSESSSSIPVFDATEKTAQEVPRKVLAEKTSATNTIEDLNKTALRVDSDFNPFSIPQDVLDLVPDTVISACEILPVRSTDKTIEFYYATDFQKQKAQKLLLCTPLAKWKYVWTTVSQESLAEFRTANYGKNAYHDRASKSIEAHAVNVKKEFISDTIEKAMLFDFAGEVSGEENNKIKNMLCGLIFQAVIKGATDIDIDHNQVLLENGKIRSEIIVSIRVNGRMETLWKTEMSKKAIDGVSSVLKNLAGLDSTKHNDASSGIIRGTVRKGTDLIPVELRIQFMPSGSERAVGSSTRIQTKFGFLFDLTSIGLTPHQVDLLYTNVVQGVRGIVFVTGSVNKGKNCTLVSLLMAMKKANPHKSVTLVEDTIEFILDHIRQIEIPPGTSYRDMQKRLVRYNPDVIAFGETRDEQATAAIVDLASVGHQIVTTLHANSATEVFERLGNLGIPRHKIVNSAKVSMSQILVRKVCHNCMKERDNSCERVKNFAGYLTALGYDVNTQLFKATGKLANGSICPDCEGTGYVGRTGVFEVLVVSEAIRQLILRGNTTALEIKRQALMEGFQSIWINGLMKVLNGETTVSEILEHIELPSPESEGLDMNLQFQDSILFDELSN